MRPALTSDGVMETPVGPMTIPAGLTFKSCAPQQCHQTTEVRNSPLTGRQLQEMVRQRTYRWKDQNTLRAY